MTESKFILPRIELKEGYSAVTRGGSNYTDLLDLLNDLHCGVLEIGNEAEVLVDDRPGSKLLGFCLCRYDRANDKEEWWNFLLTLESMHDNKQKVPAKLYAIFKDNRSHLANLMEEGYSVDEVIAILNEEETNEK